MFVIVNEVLKSLGLEDLIEHFKNNELNDAALQEFIENGFLKDALEDVIPAVATRIRFAIKFKSLIVSADDSTPTSTQNVVEDVDTNEKVDSKAVVAKEQDDYHQHQHSSLKPRPVQIVQVEKDSSSIVCLDNELSSILSKTGSRPIAVIGIVGPSQSGKSEFLNFLLRRLKGLQDDDTIDWMGLMKTVSSTGFSCDSNEKEERSGIWMWPEPFTLHSKKSGSNIEFDVLIMETRGLFDEQSKPSEWVKLLGLSLLASSCLLFNIVSDIEEKILEIMKEFISFGLSMYKEKNKIDNKIQKAFQKFAFLVRDWDRPDEYPYGSKGGESFILKNHPKFHVQLKKCFEEITCVLLPPPSPPLLDSEWNARISFGMEFSQTVETTIEDLVDTSHLSIKNVYSNSITGGDLMELIKNCVELFNDEEILDSDVLDDFTTQCCKSVVINKCLLSFTEAMKMKLPEANFVSDNELEGYYKEAEKKALILFKKMNKIGNKKAIEKMEDELHDQIKTSFEEFQNKNSNNRQEVLSRAHKVAVLKYSNTMEELESNQKQFLEDDDLIKASKLAEDEAMQIFDSVVKYTELEDVLVEKLKTRNSIEAKSKEFTHLYKQKKNEAEKMMMEELQKILIFYKEEMIKQINGESVSNKQLQEFHAPIFKKCNEILFKNQSDSLLYSKGQEDLVSMLRNELTSLQEQIRRDHDNFMKDCETLVNKAEEFYKEKMMAVTQIDEEEFEAAHNGIKEESIGIVKNAETIPREKKSQLLNELQYKIELVFMKLLKDVQKNKSEVEAAIKNAKKKAKNSYIEVMKKLVNSSNNPIDETKLKRRHDHEKLQANKQLKEAYEALGENFKNAEEQERAGLNGLNASIDELFMEFEKSNDLKWKNYESSADASFANAKSEYSEGVKKIIADDEEGFKKNEIQVRDNAEKYLIEKLNPKVAKPEFLQKKVDDLRKYMDVHFSECLDDFQTQLEEDEITVRAALMEARQYYNDEMKKRVNTKDWLDPVELSRINNELKEWAISIAKKEVPLEEHQERRLRKAMEVVYLKYEEENTRRRPVKNPAIGIDLGTTYSCVGVFVDGKVKIISDTGIGEVTTIPSYVAFKADHTIVVGEPAKSEALLDSLNTIFDAKRLIGRSFDDQYVQNDIKLWPFDVVNDNNNPKIKVRGKTFRPEQISAKVVFKMKQIAENYLGKKVYQAVVTVPANFNDGQRQATIAAAKIAGLNATVLNEPTAAAMAYNLHRTDDLKRNVLIFDLGGGTFDVAVLEMKGREIKVKATDGDTHLGGEDFDNNMVDDIIQRINRKHGKDLRLDRDSTDSIKKDRACCRLRRLRDQCEKAKKILSVASSTRIIVECIIVDSDGNLSVDETFTKDEFERLNNHLFEKCIKVVKKVLKDADVDKGKVDDIVLVGGSARIPKVRELLKQFFDGKKELCSKINADEAVARGAAIQAALLHGEQATSVVAGMKLIDVAPLSIGVEDVAGRMSVVIPKNTPVPCSRTEIFSTVLNNQTEVNFKVYEGELPMVRDNNFLGKFLLKDIPKAPAGREPIDCIMNIDNQGILSCKAVSRSNGKSNDIKIETYNGRMSTEEIADAKLEQLLQW